MLRASGGAAVDGWGEQPCWGGYRLDWDVIGSADASQCRSVPAAVLPAKMSCIPCHMCCSARGRQFGSEPTAPARQEMLLCALQCQEAKTCLD